MKVAFPYAHLNPGGIERVAVRLANGLADRGVCVEFALLDASGDYVSHLSPEVRLIDLHHPRFSRNLLLPNSPLVKYLKTCEADVVVSLGHGFNKLLGTLRLLYSLPGRLFFTERSTLSRRLGDPGTLRRRWRVQRARFLYRQAALCAGVSRGVVDDLLALKILPREKTRVIYNPVYREDLLMQAEEPLDHHWLRADEPPVILGVGRFVATKSFDDLIRAFAGLRERGIEARLVLLGDGEERGRLENLVRELDLAPHVEFAGTVSNPYAWMSRAALLVSASRLEGFGNVIAEALACGCNVVATDCPSGPREILEDGKWGRLVPVGDIEALTSAIRETLARPMPAGDLRRRASFFSEKSSLEEYYKTLCEIAPNR